MADDQAFQKVDFNKLDASTKSVIAANAASQGISAQEYYESRGGVNKAGYYGDSYKPGVTLTDKEYFDTLNAAKQSGATGAALGGAINAASAQKRQEFMQQMGFTNQDQYNAYVNGTTELQERNRRLVEQRGSFSTTGTSYNYENNQTTNEVAPIPLTPSSFSSQPSNISPVTQTPPPPPVKTAPIDTILFDEDAVPIQIMSDLIFENIGGQELINVARNDTVNGQTVIYQPIKNLTSIQQEYNPNNIVALQATSDKYFQNFSIKLDNKVPSPGTGPDGSHVYIEPATGNLVVEAVNVDLDEQIELEITTGGTIYEADL